MTQPPLVPRLLTIFLLLAGRPIPSRADEEREPATAQRDCGPLALTLPLAIEGVSTSQEQVVSRFPAPGPSGHSMFTLREVASGFGISLEGRDLGRAVSALDRPMILLFRRGGHGHFTVIRPIGHTGRLVQVIDPATEPQVVDKAEVVKWREWTGMALIPRRGGPRALIMGVVATFGLVAFFFVVRCLRAGHSNRPAEPAPSGSSFSDLGPRRRNWGQPTGPGQS